MLHAINLDQEEPDPRNVKIMFAVQKFILQTRYVEKQFPKNRKIFKIERPEKNRERKKTAK